MINKPAMLLTAYKDFDLLYMLLKYYGDFYKCYVHVDKRVKIPSNWSEKIHALPNVVVFQKYTIYWGSSNHILAFIYLMKRAIADGCDYFHILPANAFPVKSFNDMKEFYSKYGENNFIEMLNVDAYPEYQERQKYYYFQNIYDKRSDRGYTIETKLLTLQKKLGIERKVRLKEKGYLYCHLSHDFAEYVIRYLRKNPMYLLRLRTMSISEEFFFQNIMYVSPFMGTLVHSHLIYDNWDAINNGSPNLLNKEQIALAMKSNCLFARKICDIELGENVLDEISLY